MSDNIADLVQRLEDGPARDYDLVAKLRGYEALCIEAAQALTRIAGDRDEARAIVRDTHWMAVRYADGRKSYAPGMCNDAIRKGYDGGWLTYRDDKQHDLDPQYARDGDKPEYRSIESRAQAAEVERDRLAALVARMSGTLFSASIHLEEWPYDDKSQIDKAHRIAAEADAVARESLGETP